MVSFSEQSSRMNRCANVMHYTVCCLRGLVPPVSICCDFAGVKWTDSPCPSSGAEDLGFESHLRRDFSGLSHTSDLTIGTPVLPCQALGIIGSALGLVGPMSVYCDWVR